MNILGSRKVITRFIVIALLVVAAVQVAALVNDTTKSDSNAPLFQRKIAVGDTILPLHGLSENGSEDVLYFGRDGRWTVLLAFKADCPYCLAVAPAWREWLSSSHPVDVILVTRDSIQTAVEFRDRYLNNLRLFTVVNAAFGSIEHNFVARTPWVFLIDDHSVVRYHGHGSNLALVDSIIDENVTKKGRLAG